MSDFVVPPALERGDRVAVLAPSSGGAASAPNVYEQGLERLRSVFDLEPVEFPSVEKGTEYLLEHPEERAREVTEAFADPDIRGIIATIGGNDQLRILPHLDAETIRSNPTRFYGYSDNTNLALYLWNLGIVSFQGPAVMTQLAYGPSMHEYTVEMCEVAFFSETIGEIEPAPEFTDDNISWNRDEALSYERELEPNPGWRFHGPETTVRGRVWGGCLEIVEMQLVADRWLPDPAALDGAVLAMETSEELRDANWVWELLVSMGERGLLQRFDGVLVGRAKARTHREDRPAGEREAHRSEQREAVTDVLDRYNPEAPVVFNVDFGHTDPIVPLPVGSRVTIDPDAERIEFRGA